MSRSARSPSRSPGVVLRAVPSTPPEPTLASTVLDRLRGEIVRAELRPGEKLRLEPLAERYHVGRTPLREACCRLVAEGLVTLEDQRGFRVASISRADLIDIVRTRQQIDGLALRAALQHGDLAWEGEVTAALHRLERLRPPADGALDSAWEREHAGLHESLLSACGSPLLLGFHRSLFERSERYRRLAQGQGARPRDVDGEHAALVRAALARDAERAVALLVEHIASTADQVLAHPLFAATEQRGAKISTK